MSGPLRSPYTDVFGLSARECHSLYADLQKVLAAISSSPRYAFQIRKNAELSNTKEVRRLIRQSGLVSPFDVAYTPDGINITILKDHGHLTASLRW
ncbi:hypothetical protein ACQCVE_09910 [Metabacillus sp. 113a]|uniref:hypothetical protein n=1 Tax=Metabacillus sp. 113a TaxID=3404706 RepID=UPI003CEF7677